MAKDPWADADPQPGDFDAELALLDASMVEHHSSNPDARRGEVVADLLRAGAEQLDGLALERLLSELEALPRRAVAVGEDGRLRPPAAGRRRRAKRAALEVVKKVLTGRDRGRGSVPSCGRVGALASVARSLRDSSLGAQCVVQSVDDYRASPDDDGTVRRHEER